jgi:hypothetical protein
MKYHQDGDSSQLQENLQEISTIVWTAAKDCQGDTHSLLALLRTLDHLHRDIREQLFEPSLPNTRNALASLLKEIAETGGWPYIERMRLQALLQKLIAEEKTVASEQSNP